MPRAAVPALIRRSALNILKAAITLSVPKCCCRGPFCTIALRCRHNLAPGNCAHKRAVLLRKWHMQKSQNTPGNADIGVFALEDDGTYPNNPRWPLLVYRRALELRGRDAA